MANNHMGSVKHAKRIIDKFSKICFENKINAGIKLQFRNLETFIHPDFIRRDDLKFIKRFNETRLSKNEFREIVDYIKSKNILAITTPFDNESIPLTEELDIDIIKVASCSIDDWPLLMEISNINKKIIISTAGAEISHIIKVYDLFKSKNRDFAIMHCVGEYPTPYENSNLNRINLLKNQFPDIEIGFSTHESPKSKTVAPIAVAMGCSIIEKHIGLETDDFKLNNYSLNPDEFSCFIDEVKSLQKALNGNSDLEKESLRSLKRGIYLKDNLSKGSILKESNLFLAMPIQDGMLDASFYFKILGKAASKDLIKNEGIFEKDLIDNEFNIKIKSIISKVAKALQNSKCTISEKDEMEISAHYGINKFFETGAFIISKVNRSYCKKLIVLLPNQNHPSHKHSIKEETFELLEGDCKLILNGKSIALKKGYPILINKGVSHSFSSNKGCVIEEISTTHIKGDSIYEDPSINKLTLEERKININYNFFK